MAIGKHKNASIMRIVLLSSILSLLSLTTVMAQEPAICGDWIGVYQGDVISDDVNSDGSRYFIQKDFKRYIRVKLIDGCYTVRMKTTIADESSFKYAPEGEIIEANDRMIKWKVNLGSEYDWTSSAKHKGIPIGHADYFHYCTIILSKGTLKYSDYMLTIYYDRQGREIDKDISLKKDGQTLYKEDSDW